MRHAYLNWFMDIEYARIITDPVMLHNLLMKYNRVCFVFLSRQAACSPTLRFLIDELLYKFRRHLYLHTACMRSP